MTWLSSGDRSRTPQEASAKGKRRSSSTSLSRYSVLNKYILGRRPTDASRDVLPPPTPVVNARDDEREPLLVVLHGGQVV